MKRHVTRGLLPGRFMPLHEGHIFICRAALQLCDELTVLVHSQDGDPLSGKGPVEQIQEMFPDVRIVHCKEDLPREAEARRVWRTLVKRLHR